MITADHLISELQRLGVYFVVGDSRAKIFTPVSPAELLAGLTVQSDARLRSALIAVLLQNPDLADHANAALENLAISQHLTFQLYYTAAHYLQLSYSDELQQTIGAFQKLPDLYSKTLEILPVDKSGSAPLKQLANRHQEITGLPINWYGMYHHVAQRVITRLEKEQEWTRV